MKKWKVRIVVVLVTLIIFGTSFAGVLYAEEQKAINRKLNEAKRISTELENYRSLAIADEKAKKEEYRKFMEDARRQYEDILKKQPELVKQHTNSVPVTVTQDQKVSKKVVVASGSSSSGGSKVSTTSKSSSSSSSKPKTTRKTKSS